MEIRDRLITRYGQKDAQRARNRIRQLDTKRERERRGEEQRENRHSYTSRP